MEDCINIPFLMCFIITSESNGIDKRSNGKSIEVALLLANWVYAANDENLSKKHFTHDRFHHCEIG